MTRRCPGNAARAALLFLLLRITPGCSSDDTDGLANEPDDAGTGGSSKGAAGAGGSGAGGTPGGAGGSASAGTPGAGGASVAIESERAACRVYIEAACARLHECNGRRLETCLALRQHCPDYMFSPGGTRTPEGLVACAAEWKALPCGAANNGASPGCATAGALAIGEPCLYQHQCSTAFCTVNGGTSCGACARAPGPGEACDPATQRCSAGLSCDAGTCSVPPPEEAQRLAPLAPCADDTRPCSDGYTCSDDGPMSPLLCRPLPGSNEPCVDCPGEEGEACTEPLDSCADGTACSGGLCRSTGRLGLFASVCEP